MAPMNLSLPSRASPHSHVHSSAVRCSRAVMPRRRDVHLKAGSGSQDLSAFGSSSNRARTLAERVAERMGNDSPSSSDNWHAKVAGTVDAVVSGNDASYASENTPPTTIKAAADAFNRQSATDQKRMADVVSDFGACIKVVGCGGGGSNAINDMMRNVGLDAAQFIAINTDAQALKINMAPTRLQVGERVTRGLGTGGDPELGELAAQESEALIAESLAGSDLTFIAAGMGGGTGSGSAPVVAKISRALGALTIGIVTTPFSFEGRRRTKQAEESIARLKEEVDALIIVPNDKLLSATEEDTSLQDAFRLSDSVLRQGVRGISEIITQAGLINVDFADVRSVMASAGNAMLGIGIATGKNRAAEAAREAVFSPLLDDGITCATGIVYNITGPPNLSLQEVNEASRAIAELADPEANIIFGACIDETMTEGQVQVTVVATGFYSDREAKNLPSGQVWNRDVEDFMGSTTNNNSVSVPSYLSRKKEAESRKRSGWWR